jgi:hypothetical protein
MDNENRLKDRLDRAYKKVVEEVLKSEDQLDAKHKLYQSNTKRIDTSLTNKLKTFDESITQLHADYKLIHSDLEKAHKQDIVKLDKQEKETTKIYEKDLKELDQELESKRTLNTLKEEKIDNDYKITLDSIKQDYNKKQKALDKEIDKANKNFYEKQLQLEKETDIKKTTQTTINEEKNKELSLSIDKVNESAIKETQSIEKKIKEFEIAFSKSIKEALKAYKEALKPIDLELETLLKNHETDLSEINTYYDNEINKKTKYQKEKEKIADHTAANDYAKEIKKLQKTLKETIDNKKEQYKQAKIPIDKQKEDTIKHHQDTLFNLKKDGIEKIYLYLNSLHVVKTKQLIDINTINIKLLEQQAEFDYKMDSVQIDHDIQMINYNQTQEEARLYYENFTERLKPTQTIDEESAKKTFNEQLNELTKSRNYIKEVHKKDVKLRKLQHALTLHQIDYEKDRLSHMFTFDKRALQIDKNNHFVTKDNDKENFLIKHYYIYTKNYIALKSDGMLVYKPSVEKEVENRKNLEITRYEKMMKQAEKDHEIIMNNIEEIYKHEIKIYEEAYKEIEQTHKETIIQLAKHHQEELQKDKDTIDLLDPKADKGLIKKQLKAFDYKKNEFKEIMDEKKVELEEKLAIYQKMIDQIKGYRLHSSEEADTLLNHIKDQLSDAINHVKQQAADEIERYNKLYFEIKHSSDLFETFQRQREEDTLTEAGEYLKVRQAKENETKATYKEMLNESLDSIKNTFKAYEEENHNDQNETIENCKKAIEQIETIKEENLKNLIDQFNHEKRRLEGLIAKLTKNYDQQLKQLTNEKDKEKALCFKRKDEAENLLKETLSIRQKEKNAYINEREHLKIKDLNRYKEFQNQILKGLEVDAINRLNEDQVQDIKDYLLGVKAIEFQK